MNIPGWLGLIGLGQRAGSLAVGTSGARAALQRGEAALVVLAADHGPRTEEKVGRLARGRGIPVVRGPDAHELGRLLGRDAVQALAVCDARLAAGVLEQQEHSDRDVQGGTG